MNKELFWAIFGIIISTALIVFSINRAIVKTTEEIKKVGLKNIIEEVWEGKK